MEGSVRDREELICPVVKDEALSVLFFTADQNMISLSIASENGVSHDYFFI